MRRRECIVLLACAAAWDGCAIAKDRVYRVGSLSLLARANEVVE